MDTFLEILIAIVKYLAIAIWWVLTMLWTFLCWITPYIWNFICWLFDFSVKLGSQAGDETHPIFGIIIGVLCFISPIIIITLLFKIVGAFFDDGGGGGSFGGSRSSYREDEPPEKDDGWFSSSNDERTECSNCGSSNYGGGCQYGEYINRLNNKVHRHNPDRKHCVYCGGSMMGGGCQYSPSGNHTRH